MQQLLFNESSADPNLKSLMHITNLQTLYGYFKRVSAPTFLGGLSKGIYNDKINECIVLSQQNGPETYQKLSSKRQKMQKMRVSDDQTLSSAKQKSTLGSDRVVLSGMQQTWGSNKNRWVDHGDKALLDIHKHRSGLVFDKHFECVIPDLQLEFLLESQGIDPADYSAYLDPGLDSDNPGYFTHKVCLHESDDLSDGDVSGDITESFYPVIKGGRWNPYIRYSSSRVSGSQQTHKLLDLVGVDLDGVYSKLFSGGFDLDHKFDHESAFDSLVLSYPFEIDQLLLTEKYRSRAPYKLTKKGTKSHKKDIRSEHIIDRAHRCYRSFFDKLYDHFDIDSDSLLGSISRLHLWSSEIPFMPNMHHHALIPHFIYHRVSDEFRLDLDEWIRAYYYEFTDYDPGSDSFQDPFICDVELRNTKLIRRHKIKSSHGNVGGESSHTVESYPANRFILDQARYDEFRLFVSKYLSEKLGFDQLAWANRNYPLDVAAIRELWSTCVYDEFGDILGDRDGRVCDVFVEFIPISHRSKLLHALQYATRPPVGDLDSFFKKCDGVVNGYQPDDLNPDAAVGFVRSKFVDAALSDNVRLVTKYDSMLDKIQLLVQDHDASDFFSWLQFLSTWSTETRIAGFWSYIKRYMIDPDRLFTVIDEVCPVCGDRITSVERVAYPVVDHIIIRGRRKFMIVDLQKPPPSMTTLSSPLESSSSPLESSLVYCSHCHELIGYRDDVGNGGYCPECLELSMFVTKE